MSEPAGLITSPPGRLRSEVLVIGSGPGGSLAAGLLSEAGREVLVLEEGPFLALESTRAFSREEMASKYRNGGLTVALGRPKINYVEGCCVGGGSEINSGLYHRPPAEVLDEWRRSHRVEALTEQDLRPHHEAIERDLSVSLMKGPAPRASLKLSEGAERLGWQSVEVPRWFDYDRPAVGNPGAGTRQTMTKTFVKRALAAGARLLPLTRAFRLQQAGGRWIVHAESLGAPARRVAIEAEHVFLAGGAIQTPALLRRSRLGNHVGNSLRLHPTIKVVASFAEEVNTPGMGVPVHQVKEFSPRYRFGCSISSLPYIELAMVDHPAHAGEVASQWRQTAIYYAMTRGGSGRVRALPFFRDPLVRYRLSGEEMADLRLALRDLCRCLLAAGAVALYPSIVEGPRLASISDLDRLPDVLPRDRTNLMTIHLFSSCPMGEDRSRCTADSFGRVHGLRNLWIADASLLPGPPGVNPQGTIMGIVRRNVTHFLE
jgi:choline dehydrogenase-like flavoprotein